MQHYAPSVPPLVKEGQGPGQVHHLNLTQDDGGGQGPVGIFSDLV